MAGIEKGIKPNAAIKAARIQTSKETKGLSTALSAPYIHTGTEEIITDKIF